MKMPPNGWRCGSCCRPTASASPRLALALGAWPSSIPGYEQIILFDYSRTLLADAARDWGADPRFVFVAGNVYDLPLTAGILDTLVMVRVMHHLADVPAALAQLQHTLHRQSVAVSGVCQQAQREIVVALGPAAAGMVPARPGADRVRRAELRFSPGVDGRTAGGGRFRRAPAPGGLAFPAGADQGSDRRRPPGAVGQPAVRRRGRLSAGAERLRTGNIAHGGAAPPVPRTRSRCGACFAARVGKGAPLEPVAGQRVRCSACGAAVRPRAGVWDFKEAIS